MPTLEPTPAFFARLRHGCEPDDLSDFITLLCEGQLPFAITFDRATLFRAFENYFNPPAASAAEAEARRHLEARTPALNQSPMVLPPVGALAKEAIKNFETTFLPSLRSAFDRRFIAAAATTGKRAWHDPKLTGVRDWLIRAADGAERRSMTKGPGADATVDYVGWYREVEDEKTRLRQSGQKTGLFESAVRNLNRYDTGTAKTYHYRGKRELGLVKVRAPRKKQQN